MNAAKHFTCEVRWSAEDQGYVGTVTELPLMSWVDQTHSKALEGIRAAVADVVKDMLASGETLPQPLADRVC